MSRRNKIVLESPESKALKDMRTKREMSLQKMADALSVSKQLVHLIESGRANVSDEYIDKCLAALDYSRNDFELLVSRQANKKGPSLRQRCHDKLDKIENSKLEKIFDYLAKL